ncbi:MAG: Fur family transcriptional regulator [Acidimicrobiales bacterium]
MDNTKHTDHEDLLRRSGVQVTAQRLAVLRAVAIRPHGTAEDVERLARREIGTISRQSVYDALAVLTDRAIIRRIQPARSPARYEQRVDDNHHHLVCRDCGETVDVDCVVGSRPCLDIDYDHGYVVDEAEVIFWGRCMQCQSSTIMPHTTQPSTLKSQGAH